MRNYKISSSSKILFLIIGLIMLILIIIAVILTIDYINKDGVFDKKPEQKITKLQDEFERVSTNPIISESGAYNKMATTLAELKTGLLSEEQEIEKLHSLWEMIIGLYQSTSNPEYYKMQLVLNEYIKKNYPDIDHSNYKPLCFDASCADEPMPKEIESVIKKIQASDIPNHIKDNDIQNLRSFGYVNKDWRLLKVESFLFYADELRFSSEYEKLGINNQIADEILAYVKKNYRDIYEEYMSHVVTGAPSITPAPVPTDLLYVNEE